MPPTPFEHLEPRRLLSTIAWDGGSPIVGSPTNSQTYVVKRGN